MEIDIVLVGATGLVGETFLRCFQERKLPIRELHLFSLHNAGKVIKFGGREIIVKKPDKIPLVDVAFFSAGKDVSLKLAPEFVKKGALVIDNSPAFRMNDNVPLVVPEINPEDAFRHKGIIANPNCSTIIALLPIYHLDKNYGIKRIIASTYQSVSGAGREALRDLDGGTREVFPSGIKNNLIPLIGELLEDGYTTEEIKMENETRKILHNNSIRISATCVRVPVRISHSISLTLELERNFNLKDVYKIFEKADGIVLYEPYITPEEVAGKDEVFVGRIRRNRVFDNGISMWVVGDNLRKGAATNACQILEYMLKQGWQPKQ